MAPGQVSVPERSDPATLSHIAVFGKGYGGFFWDLPSSWAMMEQWQR